MKTWNEAKAVTSYREFLSQELERPDVRDAKKKLIGRYFSPAPVLTPVFSIPVMGLALVLVSFLRMQPEGRIFQPSSGTAFSAARITAEATVPAEVDGKVPASRAHRPVVVKRVSSRAGAAMVYQKHYKDAPITIVWVFPASGGSAF